MRLLDLDALAGFLLIGRGERLVEIHIELARRIVGHVEQRHIGGKRRARPEQARDDGRIRRNSFPVSIRRDDIIVIDEHGSITRDRSALQVNETAFQCLRRCSVIVLRRSVLGSRSMRVDAAFRLGPAAPAAGARILIGRGPAGAGHAADRQITRRQRADAAADWQPHRSPRSPRARHWRTD